MILWEIKNCVRNKATCLSLWVPSLITELCLAAGVEFDADDEWLEPHGPIYLLKKAGAGSVQKKRKLETGLTSGGAAT